MVVHNYLSKRNNIQCRLTFLVYLVTLAILTGFRHLLPSSSLGFLDSCLYLNSGDIRDTDKLVCQMNRY